LSNSRHRGNGARPLVRYALVAGWAVFTVSLTAWWLIFSLSQLDRIYALDHQTAPQLARYQRMLHLEGATLFLFLLGGAAALIYYMFRELKQREAIQEFLSIFTHELKTPLASLRLQAEILMESVKDRAQAELLRRLIADAGRLSLRLDNCLFLADLGRYQLLSETVDLKDIVQTLSGRWPDLKISQRGDCDLRVDRRAMESIIQNLMQNALLHGQASRMEISAEAQQGGLVRLFFRDNGVGFKGERKKLGRLFQRFYPGSGSGIGLFLVKRLVQQMGGTVELLDSHPGFEVALSLPGAMR